MKILAIDTSCDETAAAVIENATVLSNIIWSQAAAHAQFGGVMPSLAQRMHRERIGWVIDQAIHKSQIPINKIEAIAVTQGPGLAIALEVGILKAKELAQKYSLPLIPINHIEGHLLSPLAVSNTLSNPPLNLRGGGLGGVIFPALGLVISGGHTELILINKIGDYKILAKTQDDALGEALDKAARMLGLGYPGGAVLEKMARLGNPKAYPLPLPMARNKEAGYFSYSGLKTAMYRLISTQFSTLSAQNIYDLAAVFQNRAFQHMERVVSNSLWHLPLNLRGRTLLVGGGVAANMEIRKRLRVLGKEMSFRVRLPYSMKLVGDNAAMVGVAASFHITNNKILIPMEQIDRRPRWSIEELGL
jgi:N6-L-threonylcarbamoyladenine synthase